MELVGMNRSLEALAILVMCLVGILAAVRISTKDQASASRATDSEPAGEPEKMAPAKSSSSAVEAAVEASRECLAWQSLDYEGGCGLDRSTGQVYRPLTPFLSPSEFAARVIRSEPLSLIVLADVAVSEEPTGYDSAYDEAMGGQLVTSQTNDAIDYLQVEADYAAAELAAAQPAGSLAKWATAVVPWAREQFQLAEEAAISNVSHYQRAYTPLVRAIHVRWTEHVAPKLRLFPRPPATARHNLLLRQRAERQQPRVRWDDYLSFAERKLSPLVARDVEANESLRSR
jgi:hypothetical protein